MDPSNSTPDSMANAMDMDGAGTPPEAQVPIKDTQRNRKTYDDLFPSLPESDHHGPGGSQAGASNPIGEWNRKPVLHSGIVTQFLNIPKGERRNWEFGVDESFKSLKGVMDRTAAKIEMSSSKDHTLTFLITGRQDAVMKARRELLAHFQTQQSVTVSVPKEHHRFILGRGGSRLMELEQRTATKISIPKAADSIDDVTVTGPKDGIEKAVHMINVLSDQQSKQACEVLQVLKIYHPFINGPNNEQVKKMMADHPNVRIHIPPLSIVKDEISVAGEKESVIKVVETINGIVRDLEKKSTTVGVEVKKSQHKYIIGPKGNSINEILADTGVFVEMPPLESSSETITLRGPQEKLGLALTKVYEKANSVVNHEVSCPRWLHKYIIGRKGASIQKLMLDLPKVHVEFVESSGSIKIDGPPDEADKARDILEAQANELNSTMEFAEIAVDAKYHKHIIGKGGSTVNRLKQEREVSINIPDVDKGVANIRIEGNKEGVRMAMKELQEMVVKMQNEKEKDMIIENRFHRQLIGPKGENIQKVRDDFANVQISFPDLGVQSDLVKLRGPRQDVDKCGLVLNKMYKDLMETSFQAKFPIFKQFRKSMVANSGAAIKRIRQEMDTRIELSDGGDSDVVTITGRKANVEATQKKIQQMQADMANVVTVDIQIPAKIHNTVIGVGGKLIQSVMDDCGGVHIKFPEAKSGSDKVLIRGPKEDVEKASEMLLSLANEKQLNNVVEEVRARPEHHKFLIGRQGVNIQSVRESTGARIFFPGEKDSDKEAITILGSKEAVAKAKVELESRIKALDNVIEDTMTVDPKHHKYFVAKRGEVLRNIGNEYGGVVISFPRIGAPNSDKVTLKGAKECVAGARKRMEELVTDLECQVTIECVIEQQHHRTVMGSRGCNIQKVCHDFEVQIKIPDRKPSAPEEMAAVAVNGHGQQQDSDVIRISGKQENCDAAAAALKALVPISVGVEVPFDYHRYIIGLSGAGVKKLMADHDINIKVPNSEERSSTIIVTGPAANVEAARVSIAGRVDEIKAKLADDELRAFEIKIEVDPEYHSKIIGRSGARITQLRKAHSVNVQLPRKDDPEPSIITITGYEANAAAARDAILDIVKEYESMTKEEVRVDHRVHSMIIGRKGAEIRRIMQKYKVEVKLPREGDPDPDCILVMGSEDAVFNCRDHLLNVEEEFLQEVMDKENLRAYEMAPLKQLQQQNEKARVNNNNNSGFEVAAGAPWQGDSDAFPTLGGGDGARGAVSTSSSNVSTPVWGPRR